MDKPTVNRQNILAVLRSPNPYSFYLLFLLFGFCSLFYYFGELVDSFGWEALRWDFLYGVHDVHRLLFLAPILYASYVFGAKATTFITIIALMTFLPRALFISPFPDPILRMVLFTIIAGAMGYLTAKAHGETEQHRRLEALLIDQRDAILEMLERIEDGVLIIGPDYRIRFINPSMVREFGEGIGSLCYKYLRNLDAPCEQICKLPNVISGATEKWEYNFPDGRTYRVLSSPYVDSDGVVCQLAIFRNMGKRKKV